MVVEDEDEEHKTPGGGGKSTLWEDVCTAGKCLSNRKTGISYLPVVSVGRNLRQPAAPY